MAQFLVPASDISNAGAWVTAPLWSKINDNSDATTVSSPTGTNPSAIFVVGLTTGSTPETGTRTVRFRVRKDASGGQARSCTVRLLDSSDNQLETFNTGALANTFATFSFTVSAAISSYTGLRIEVSDIRDGGGQARGLVFAWAEFEIPDAAPIAYDIAAEKGSFLLSGKNADLLYAQAYLLDASKGAFTLTGKNSDLIYAKAYLVDVNKGSFLISGKIAELLKGNVILPEKGTFTLTGKNVDLIYATSGAYIINANKGSFVLTGKPIYLAYPSLIERIVVYNGNALRYNNKITARYTV